MISPTTIGIEIGPNRLHALRIRRGGRAPPEAMETEWSAERSTDTVAALRERFGTGARLAVAIATPALFLKRLALPALPAAERRRLIALDAERYFPVRDESMVVGVGADDLVVAARAEPFDRMLDALAQFGAVERVEPAPAALARHLGASGVPDAFIVMAGPGDRDCAVALMRGGRLVSVRKLPTDALEIAAAAPNPPEPPLPAYLYPWLETLAAELARCGLRVEPVPAPRGSAESFAGARGALLGIDAPDGLTLTSPALERRQRTRAWRRGALAIAAIVAAVAVALWSADLRRAHVLAELERRIAAHQEHVAELERLQAGVAVARQEIATLAAVSRERPDPLAVLLRIANLLPPDAHLRTLHATENVWELDGYARDAASLIPTFATGETFADVRFRSATTRLQVGDRTYENFSLALRYIRPSH